MRVLVILRPKPNVGLTQFAPHIVAEEKKLWDYLTGDQCRWIFYHAESPGTIVLDFEGQTSSDIREWVNAFPMVKAGLFDVELLPLAPCQGLAALFAGEHGIEMELPHSWQAP